MILLNGFFLALSDSTRASRASFRPLAFCSSTTGTLHGRKLKKLDFARHIPSRTSIVPSRIKLSVQAAQADKVKDTEPFFGRVQSASLNQFNLEEFLAWATSRDIFPHSIKVDVCNGRRGIFATDDIQKGDSLLEVPDWLFSFFSTLAVSSLPDGWETDADPVTGRPLFINQAEHTATFDRPVPNLQYFQDFTSPIAGISREMWEGFPWQWTLALRLMAEVDRGAASPVLPYLSVLPKEYHTSLWRFSDAELAEMQVPHDFVLRAT